MCGEHDPQLPFWRQWWLHNKGTMFVIFVFMMIWAVSFMAGEK